MADKNKSIYRYQFKTNPARGWRYMRKDASTGKFINRYFMDSIYGGSKKAREAAELYKFRVEGCERLHPGYTLEQCFDDADSRS